MHPNEGMDARLHAAIKRQVVARFEFVRPGLAPLERLRARLREERKAEARTTTDWPRVFRYTGPGRHAVGARDLEPGDTVELTEEQAASFADRFVPADQPTAPAPVAEEEADTTS